MSFDQDDWRDPPAPAQPGTVGQVLLVSSRPMFVRVNRAVLATLASPVACSQCPDAHRATQWLQGQPADLVLLDAGPLDGAELLQSMDLLCEASMGTTTSNTPAALAVVIDEPDDARTQACALAGATGVIVKQSPPQVIVASLQRLLAGEPVFPAPLSSNEAWALPEGLAAQLTPRQQRLLRRLSGGQGVAEVARELDMTPVAVISQMRQVLEIVRGRTARVLPDLQ